MLVINIVMFPLVQGRHSRDPQPQRHQPKFTRLISSRLMQTHSLTTTFRGLSRRLPLCISLYEDTQQCQFDHKASLIHLGNFWQPASNLGQMGTTGKTRSQVHGSDLRGQEPSLHHIRIFKFHPRKNLSTSSSKNSQQS